MTNPLNPKSRSNQEPYECGCPNKAKKKGKQGKIQEDGEKSNATAGSWAVRTRGPRGIQKGREPEGQKIIKAN